MYYKMPNPVINKAYLKNLVGDFDNVLKKLSVDELAQIIQYANYQYYNMGDKPFHDNVYDMLKERLEKLDKHHPILKHVGAVVAKGDKRKVALPYWMGSMDKIKSDKDTIHKWKKSYEGSVVISDKLDGNSGMVQYKDGVLRIFTRGNGIEGLDISHIGAFVCHVPTVDKVSPHFKELTVRGEFIISKEDFDKVKDQGANARNMVAGVLNSIKPNLELVKYVQFIAYEMVFPHHEPSNQFKLLHKLGFKNVHHQTQNMTKVDVESLSQELVERRRVSEFEIDGIIVMHNGIHNRVQGENPKHAFAFKSVAMMNQAEVLVTKVAWNISKDGLMKPVVNFDPVDLGGAMVGKATGFNAKYIKDNGIGVGAKILVMRSGDVIPHIIKVVETTTPDLPTNIKYSWNNSRVDIVADISNAGDEIKIKNIVFFFNKIDVHGLSQGILAKLYASGFDTVGKILAMKERDFLNVDGIREKMAKKLYDSIQQRFQTVDTVLLAAATNVFGHGMGEKKLQYVVDKYPEFLSKESFCPSESQLVDIQGFSNKSASVILVHLPKYWVFVKENGLMKFIKRKSASINVAMARLALDDDKKDVLPAKYAGMGFLFTGVRDKPLEEYIKSNGGAIKTSISKNVNVLICKDPESTSSKMQEARALGIKIVTLEQFKKSENLLHV